ncbi:MAG: hypothetical protein DRI44_02825 [Chlamydiae bacterium]|nr:MAG: hypothetical protein DRI44_02825 [Chlamydiota bacterium]
MAGQASTFFIMNTSNLTIVAGCFIALLCSACQGEKKMNKSLKIRHSVIAGSWYTANKSALTRELEGYLAKAKNISENRRVEAIIVPHAGYAYSGRCAAWSYKQLEGKKIKRIFILAPSHYVAFRGVSIADVDAYETPLGLVPLDKKTVLDLQKSPLIGNVPQAHTREHSLEIQLPFLQSVLSNFTIVPMIVGDINLTDAEAIGKLIAEKTGPDDLIVGSGDFTHYGASFGYMPFKSNVAESITTLDMGFLDLILAKNTSGIFDYVEKTGITCCGRWAFAILIAALPEHATGEKLYYYKSGDMENDYRHSVSYVAAEFYSHIKIEKKASSESNKDMPPLTKEEKTTLLKIARDTLTMHVEGKGKPDLSKYNLTPRLKEKAGAFVTLHEKGQLRGCIGYIEGIAPLAETVRENACNASTEDPRFPPVQPSELKDIDIEVSVMSPLRKIASPDEVIAGKHGVILKKGWHQGVFLPQVATEQGWDRETFLKHLGLKAGLDMDAYKNGELYVFTAEVFGEKDR